MTRCQLPFPYLFSGLLFAASIPAAAGDPLSVRRVRDPVLQQSMLMPIHAASKAPVTTRLPIHALRRSLRADTPRRVARTANNRRVRNDIDGDGRTDLLWNRWTWSCRTCPESASGVLAYWTMNGASTIGTASFWYHRDYVVEATGDFDGDGRTDILWTRTEGIDSVTYIDHYYIWRSRGDGGFDGQYLASLQNAYVTHTVADIDGDGKDDLIFQGRAGGPDRFMRYWLLDGASIKRIGNVYSIASDFRLTGIDDFDGDGRGDILWTHVANGDMHLWRGKVDGHFEDGVYIGTGNAPRLWGDWRVAHLHDIDNDGRSDIIWETLTYTVFGRTPTQRARAAYWLMDGTSIRGIRVFDAPAADSYIAAVGDLDGDGHGDFFWRNRVERDSIDRIQLWRGRVDGGFDEHFIRRFDPAWLLIR